MKFLKYFLLGFIITASFHILQFLSCEDGDPISLNDISKTSGIDMAKVNEAGVKIEKAFASGDYKQVEAILTAQAALENKDILPTLESGKMQEYASLFKKRTFRGGGQWYAEFGFPYEGKTYTVALARQGDGSYKLMRF